MDILRNLEIGDFRGYWDVKGRYNLLNAVLKRSKSMVLLAVPIIFFVVTGCGTLKNGRGWGEDAIWPVELKRIPDAASHAFFDLQTLIPAAGAIVFGVSHADHKVSDWAINHTPIFGSKNNANNASDYLLGALEVETFVTSLGTPSGNEPKDWVYSKVKGVSVELGAELVTIGTTSLLKNVTGRERPEGGSKSFPSGHASAAFSSSTLANRNLNEIKMEEGLRLPLQIGNLLLATSVGWARVEAGEHFPSDVLAGAALGHFLSAFIHDVFMGLPRDNRLSFDVLPSKHGVMIGISFGF
jgi:membrane-associated phospholipid phosphatase